MTERLQEVLSMGAGKRVRQRFSDKGGRAQSRIAKALDQLAQFEEFKEKILPALQRDLKDGLTPEQLREKYSPIVQAAMISTALTGKDEKARLAAQKDTLDRQEGKARERIEATHRLERLPETELDSLLLSEIQSVATPKDDSEEMH
jgi:hypothetical protein